MPEVKLTLLLEQDGRALPGFPYIRRQVVNEFQGPLEVIKAGGDVSFVAIPGVTVIPALNTFVLTTDQAYSLKFGGVGSGDGVVPLLAQGLIVIVGANIASGAATNALGENAGANPANLRIVVAGT